MRLTSTATRPAYRDDRETPLSLDRDGRLIRYFRISVKWNIFMLTIDKPQEIGGVLPDGQRPASTHKDQGIQPVGPAARWVC
jgi:hypothetical protein